jgi:hypothetical protein
LKIVLKLPSVGFPPIADIQKVAILSTGGDAAKQEKRAALPASMARRASGTVSSRTS